MTSKLFVGGLSWDTTDSSLKQAFDAHGDVTEAKIVMDRDSGRSRGFGFVTFSSPEDAAQAKQEMNGVEIDGRTISVDEANERPPRRDGGGNRGGGHGRW